MILPELEFTTVFIRKSKSYKTKGLHMLDGLTTTVRRIQSYPVRLWDRDRGVLQWLALVWIFLVALTIHQHGRGHTAPPIYLKMGSRQGIREHEFELL